MNPFHDVPFLERSPLFLRLHVSMLRVPLPELSLSSPFSPLLICGGVVGRDRTHGLLAQKYFVPFDADAINSLLWRGLEFRHLYLADSLQRLFPFSPSHLCIRFWP